MEIAIFLRRGREVEQGTSYAYELKMKGRGEGVVYFGLAVCL